MAESGTKHVHPCYEGLDSNKLVDLRPYMLDHVEFATLIAGKSPMNHQHGCVIVHKGKVIATGYNKHLKPGYSIHAEADAIMKAKKMLPATEMKNCKLYVVRIGNDQMPLKYSRPCPSCCKIIAKSKIGKVFYSTSYDFTDSSKVCVACDDAITGTTWGKSKII